MQYISHSSDNSASLINDLYMEDEQERKKEEEKYYNEEMESRSRDAKRIGFLFFYSGIIGCIYAYSRSLYLDGIIILGVSTIVAVIAAWFMRNFTTDTGAL